MAWYTQDAGAEEDEGPGEDLTGDGGKGSGPRDEAPVRKEKRALQQLTCTAVL